MDMGLVGSMLFFALFFVFFAWVFWSCYQEHGKKVICTTLLAVFGIVGSFICFLLELETVGITVLAVTLPVSFVLGVWFIITTFVDSAMLLPLPTGSRSYKRRQKQHQNWLNHQHSQKTSSAQCRAINGK